MKTWFAHLNQVTLSKLIDFSVCTKFTQFAQCLHRFYTWFTSEHLVFLGTTRCSEMRKLSVNFEQTVQTLCKLRVIYVCQFAHYNLFTP